MAVIGCVSLTMPPEKERIVREKLFILAVLEITVGHWTIIIIYLLSLSDQNLKSLSKRLFSYSENITLSKKLRVQGIKSHKSAF